MNIRIFHTYGINQIVQILEDKTISANDLADFVHFATVGDKLGSRRHINAVNVRETNLWRRGSQIDFFRAGFARHLDNLLRGGATHDGVIHQQDVFIPEFCAVSIELTAYGFPAQLLTWHDKGAANVAVFHEALAIGFIEDSGDFQRNIAGGFRNRNDHVDVQIFPLASDLLTQFGAHIDARAVDGNFVDKRVRASKIDVLKEARVADRILGALTGKQLALLGNIDRFTRRHIAQEFEAQGIQRHAFGGHHILGTTIANITFPQHQRADAVRIAERDHTVTDNHRHAGVGAADLTVGGGNRGKNVIRFQWVMTEVIQLAGEDVEQDFRIGGGVDMAAFFFKQLLAQLVRVGQIAVMRQRNTIR